MIVVGSYHTNDLNANGVILRGASTFRDRTKDHVNHFFYGYAMTTVPSGEEDSFDKWWENNKGGHFVKSGIIVRGVNEAEVKMHIMDLRKKGVVPSNPNINHQR